MSAIPVKLFQFLGAPPAPAPAIPVKSRAEIAQDRQIERQIARAKERQFSELKRESVFYWVKIRDALRRMQFYHEIKGDNKPGMAAQALTGKRAKQVVRCDAIEFDESVVRFHIDADRMPWGSMVVELLDERIERELSYVCYRTVRIKGDIATGVYIEVQREGSIAGIPELYLFKDAYLAIPKSAHITSFPIGIGEGRRALYDDLQNVRHLLVAGTNGSGKSVFINSAIMTLCMRARPDLLQLWLIDLKGGIELTYYKDLPHVPEGRFIYELEDIQPALADLHEELDRRERLFKDKAHNIAEWNRRSTRRADKLPYLVIVVDEFAEISMGLKGKTREQALTHLKRLLQKGRACGIHFILATQSPTKEVMDTLVRANVPARMALNCTTTTDSIIVVGNGDAKGLSPRGRGIWVYEGRSTHVQCPLLKKRTMKKLISKSRERWARVNAEPAFDMDDLFRYAIKEMHGQLHHASLYKAFRGAIASVKLGKYLNALDGHQITIDGVEYLIIPPDKARHIPRHLMPMQKAFIDPPDGVMLQEVARDTDTRHATNVFLKGV